MVFTLGMLVEQGTILVTQLTESDRQSQQRLNASSAAVPCLRMWRDVLTQSATVGENLRVSSVTPWAALSQPQPQKES